MSLDVVFDASFDDSSSYPHLGFNPAPGVPGDVEALESMVNKATSAMQESGKLLDQMRNSDSGVWVGDAADAFRSHFNDKLVTDLQHAQQSLTEATGTIQNWYKDLVGFKQTAQNLDQEAATAREALRNAQAQVSQAKSNPNLNLIGEVFTDPQALQQAQSALDQAESAVNDANAAERQAQDELNSILQRARQLQQEVDSAARNYASQLENATKGLAPHKPGWFSSMLHDIGSALSTVGNWIEQHANAIHSILSTISAIAGLVALCTPPPIDLVAGAVALAAGAGAFAMDLANPKTRDALGGLLTGHFTKANIEAAVTTGGDLLSAIPGVGTLKYLGKADKLATDAAKAAEDVPSLVSKLPQLAKDGEQAAEDTVKSSSKIADLVTLKAHQLSMSTKGVASVVEKVSGTALNDGAKLNIELGMRAKKVGMNLYHDFQEAF
ncbi:putative T7SS-secreted protein [Actinospica sp.]|jgi:hypothetical protein|uniref:putative T7SS-secreted protein n=1 Tax=Actinospica sp. TaxID=1872142 RepID=UPI002C48567F|nr:hypothetical protein [Actinospica sp.]HWG27476.1 hypothetical protein [Actinospica sp.]